MKKKMIVIVLLLILMMSLTSCMRIEADFTIKKNGKIDIDLLYAINQTMSSFGDMDNMDFTEEAEELKEKGWEVQLYSDGGYVGYRSSKKNVEFSETSGMFGDDTFSGALKKEGSRYVLDINAFGTDEPVEDAMDTLTMIRNFGGSIKVRITFPTKPLSHNATSVSKDGKTLEWDLLDTRLNGRIYAEFKMGSGLGKYAILASCTTLCVAFVTFLIIRSRDKKSKLVPAGEGSAMKYNEPGEVRWVQTIKVCPNCKHVSIGVGLLCSECRSKLIDTHCEKEAWNSLSSEQRNEIYQRAIGSQSKI